MKEFRFQKNEFKKENYNSWYLLKFIKFSFTIGWERFLIKNFNLEIPGHEKLILNEKNSNFTFFITFLAFFLIGISILIRLYVGDLIENHFNKK
jgi:hypothetical protein